MTTMSDNSHEPQPGKKGWLSKYLKPFVACYCTTSNRSATRAALDCGITDDKAKARRIGMHILQRPEIRRQINEYLQQTTSTPGETLVSVTEIMNFDMGVFVNEQGQIDLNSAEARAALRLVRKLTVRETKDGRNISIEPYDKLHASELMMRHHKLIGDATTSIQVDVHTAGAVLDSIPEQERDAITAELQRRLEGGLMLPAGITIEEDDSMLLEDEITLK